MREIKFRVFDTTTHDMYFPGEDGSQLVIGMSHALDEDKNYIALWSEDSEICRTGQAEFMQYTGLEDKNGVEIWVGDIVKQEYQAHIRTSYDPETLGVTDFESIEGHFIGEVVTIPSAGACLKNPIHYSLDEDSNHMTKQYKRIAAYRSEVIGNIYENPELLEVNK